MVSLRRYSLPLRTLLPLLASGLASLLNCSTRSDPPPKTPLDPATCQAQQDELVQLLQQLPERGRSRELHTVLPVATLGSIVGEGHSLEINDAGLWLNGRELTGTATEQRGAIRTHFETGTEASRQLPNRVYLAASRDLVVRRLQSVLKAIPPHIELRLLFAAPAPALTSVELLGRVIAEHDPVERKRLLTEAYTQHANCPAVQAAIASVDSLPATERWTQLRAALLQAIPQCDCASLHREPFGELLVAEQRAGAANLGSVPAEFLRDERCGASIPLRSAQWLLTEIETFDEEYSGEYRGDAMRFDKVVTNERLQRVLCAALPGETLAALQRKRHTMYWKLASANAGESPSCQGWQFDALERGSPMGNWHQRASSSPLSTPVAIHFWQGAEEIRLYGPMKTSKSKATEEGPWACRQEFRMVGITPESIELEAGRWFFNRETCEASHSPKDLMTGCIAELATGQLAPVESKPETASPTPTASQ